MLNNALEKLNRLLVVEENFTLKLYKTRAAKNLQSSRNDLLVHLREVGRSGNPSLIIATERAIVEGDLSRYANSQSMAGSLETALKQEISDSPSGLSVKLHWEGVSLPSPMATVETPADRPGSQPSHLSYGRGFKPELVLR